jgi:DNA mismatch repair protein MutS
MAKISPVRQQYLEVKRQYPDAILFFRLGDFYETFDADAEVAARELDIVLTSRSVAKGNRVPMAGIPFHAAENYLGRLIQKGYHVAICEQMGEAPVRGLFPRQVVRVVTAGTVLEPGLLPGDGNNYLAAVVVQGEDAGLAYADVSTGEFAATQMNSADPKTALRLELGRLLPSEVLHPESLELEVDHPGHSTPLPDWQFEPGQAEEKLLSHFGVASLDGFGLAGRPAAAQAAGALLAYLGSTQPEALRLLTDLTTYELGDFLLLDEATRRNLELTATLRSGELRGSLLGVLDETLTPMGRRTLRQWMAKPRLDRDEISSRLDQVQAAFDDGVWRAELRQALRPLADLERLTNRARAGMATPRDLTALRGTLQALPRLLELTLGKKERLGEAHLDPCAPTLELLERAIAEEPPAVLGQPGVIREGYSQELDEIVRSSRDAREWISALESTERQRTGIKSLRVGYNKVFGYYLEVTKPNTPLVPEDYIRKQTLVNAERYITSEMKEYESLVLNAEERIRQVESELFAEVCRQIGEQGHALLASAKSLGRLDAVAGLAEVAVRHGYARPELVEEPALEVREGRHPVVEEFLPAGRRFVPNDSVLEDGECIRVITGPNMSGKSTYLRQVALIVLMAHMGSFVPARSARIGLTDRIFARIGAQDEIHAGQSTFMVEMLEAANLLRHATSRSLLILDEIGRGTSTYDGMSIAWSVVEYLHNHPRLRARTLFATHYHELTRLADALPGVRNYNVAVSEEGGGVVFLHKIVPGGADKSYGIHVAELAGLPRPVINRAQEILARLEAEGAGGEVPAPRPSQLPLFGEVSPLLGELEELDLNGLSPLEALNLLYEWQRRLDRKESG